jgi:hypothetical protein
LASDLTSDFDDVVSLLARDVRTTLGDPHRQLIEGIVADVQELNVADKAEKVVNDVQQHFHDSFVDPTWPACPRHPHHPLWYRHGSWWCVQDGVAIAPLGSLSKRR